MIITRKIEIVVTGSEEEKKAGYSYLRLLNKQVYLVANRIMTGQFFNEEFKRRIMLSDEELNERRVKIEKEIKRLTEGLKDQDEKKVSAKTPLVNSTIRV